MVDSHIKELQQSSRDEMRQADEARQQAQRVSSELAEAKGRLTEAKQQHSSPPPSCAVSRAACSPACPRFAAPTAGIDGWVDALVCAAQVQQSTI